MTKKDRNCMIPFISFYLLISAVLLGGYHWGTFACGTLLMIWFEITVCSLVLTITALFVFVIAKRKRKQQDGRNSP